MLPLSIRHTYERGIDTRPLPSGAAAIADAEFQHLRHDILTRSARDTCCTLRWETERSRGSAQQAVSQTLASIQAVVDSVVDPENLL